MKIVIAVAVSVLISLGVVFAIYNQQLNDASKTFFAFTKKDKSGQNDNNESISDATDLSWQKNAAKGLDIRKIYPATEVNINLD
jgi:hypothetical protein